MDVYVWGYDNGQAYYHGWEQCDFKNCDECLNCFYEHAYNNFITYEAYNYDSLLIDADNWTNDCLDTALTYYY